MNPLSSKLKAVAAAPAVLALLLRLRWLHPRREMAALVTAMTPRRRTGSLAQAAAATVAARAIIRRLPWLFSQPCLYRSLVTYRYLRAAGLPAAIQVGVRGDQGDLQSHAWVVLAGEPWPPEQGVTDFRPLVTYPLGEGSGDVGEASEPEAGE